MSDDWLDLPAPSPDDTGPRAQAEDALPAPAGLPAPVAIPDDYTARAVLLAGCLSRLTDKQRLFLQAWRDCRYNARAAARSLGLSENTRPMTNGMENPDFAMVVRIWRANAAAEAIDRDRLLARQEDIVETLLTPKPILHQGVPTGFEEVEAGAAAKANETLMRVAGMFPKEGAEVAVGVQLPTINVELTTAKGEAVDAQVVEVDPSVPT